MNKKEILASLNNISNQLDNNGLFKEASILTNVMKKIAEENKKYIPLNEMPGINLYHFDGPKLRNFDPLLPVEGQEISRDELWDKFIEYLRKHDIKIYDGLSYRMWQALLKEHDMSPSHFAGYTDRVTNPEKYKNKDRYKDLEPFELGYKDPYDPANMTPCPHREYIPRPVNMR